MPTLRRGAGLLLASTILLCCPMTGVALAHDRDQEARSPTIYGHRGASGYRPEHTLASYRLAARLGADYFEPDLVSTKDHVLVARHEPAIGGTTDVADHPEFAARRTTKVIDGMPFANEWFTEDFTLAELKTLRAKERLPDIRQRNTIYNGRYEIPTFQEVIDLRDRLSRDLHRRIGIIPELKHSTYFRAAGLPLEEPFVRTLRRNHLDNRRAKVTVQSFEIANLKALDRQLPGVPLVQLLDAKTRIPGDVQAAGGTRPTVRWRSPTGCADRALRRRREPVEGLHRAAGHDDGAVAPADHVHPRRARGRARRGRVHVPQREHRTCRWSCAWAPIPREYGNAIAEYQQFFRLGVDGVFSDNPDTAKAARDDE